MPTRQNRKKVRLAVVGCGAIAEQGHLPGASVSKQVEITLLVDRSLDRANELARGFSIQETAESLESIPSHADAAIVATPPGPHAEICCRLIEMGIPVLVEKPVALNVAQCERMVAFAEEHSVLLAAGMTRRFFRSDRLIRDFVRSRVFGKLKRFEIENGYDSAWSSATTFILSKQQAGGGVLMGLGSHVLDSLLWIAGEDEKSTKYYCDAEGGIESECRLEIELVSGAKGTVELSRSRNLQNRYVMEFENARVQARFYGDEVSVSTASSDLELIGHALERSTARDNGTGIAQVMADELDDFATAVRTGSAPVATVRDAMKSIALIERCYSKPNLLEFPWMLPIELGGYP